MAVRSFNGSTDLITTSIGSVTAVGPITFAMLMKFTSAPSNSAPMATNTSVPAVSLSPIILTSGTLLGMFKPTNVDSGTMTFTTTDGWTIIVITKATGAQHANMYKFPLGGAWSNQTATSSANADGASVAGGTMTFGSATAGRIAVAAIWNVALTLAQAEALSTNLQTADWQNTALVGTAPQGLWEFNQTSIATNVQDLTGGGANQSSIVGTTVTTGDDPPGWTFGTGGSSVPITIFSVSDPAGFRIPGIH